MLQLVVAKQLPPGRSRSLTTFQRNVDTVQANVNAHIGKDLLATEGTIGAGDGRRGDVPIGSAVGDWWGEKEKQA